MKRPVLLSLLLALTACATAPEPISEAVEPTVVKVAPLARAWVQIYSPFVTCGVISEVDRKASLRQGPSEWMADKPEAVYVDEVDGELIGSPELYHRPPALIEASSESRALVVCFHTSETYGDHVEVNGHSRVSPVGPYSYEFVQPVAGKVVSVTVDENSPKEWTCYGSCPWVYLEGKAGAVRLGEILKDTIGPSMEHEASMDLPGTAGQTRIEVRIAEEEVGEVTWLNALAIRVEGRVVKPTIADFDADGDDKRAAHVVAAEVAGKDDARLRMRRGQSITVVFELDAPATEDAELLVTGFYTLGEL